jgi:pyroglutamyl-peptidase
MRCILSGFDAFGGQKANPSQKAVKLVPDSIELGNGSDIAVHRIVLPTCCTESFKRLRQAVSKVPRNEQFVIIMCGLAGKREKITLERYALNVRDYPIPDNHGHQWSERPISPRSAEAIASDVALGKLKSRLNERKLRADVSYHAGTFVCNELYYRALSAWGGDKRCQGILFVHVPSPQKYAGGKSGKNAASIRKFATALEETIKFVCGKTGRRR